MENQVSGSDSSTPVGYATPQPASAKLPGPIAILKQAWKVYKDRFWLLFGISLMPFALIVACVAVIGGGAAVGILLLPNLTAGAGGALVIAGIILAVLVYVAIIYVSLWAQAALLFAVKGADQKVGFRESFRQASHKIGSLFGAGLLVCAIVGGTVLVYALGLGILYALLSALLPSSITVYTNWILGLLALVAIPVTVILLGVRYSLVTYIVVGDNARAMSAVARSRDYVRGYWWPVFWRLLFLAFIAVVLTVVIFLLVALLGLLLKGAGAAGAVLVAVVNVVVSAILTPLYAAYAYQVYANLKAVKGESQVPADKRVGAWMILAIVVCIVVFAAAPVVLLALNSARSKSRDEKRLADARVVMADAELYHADHGTYPQRLSDTLSTQYASSSIPVAPTPADGSCTSAQNTYQYELIDAAYYQFTFCTGSSVGGYAAGVHTMTEQGIDVGYQ